MSRILLLLLLVVCFGTPLAAQDAPSRIIVRESLEPQTGAIIGQHVALRVDVLFPGEMLHPPRVSLPDVRGVQAMRFETQATTLRETIDGNAYVGQRFEFALYARRGGTIEISPAVVTLLDRQGDVIGTAKGQAVSLKATVPSGVDASEPVVATRTLTLEEQWAPSPTTTFKPGDAIVRTITRTADDVPGLAMRDLVFAAPEGVRAYVDQPDIDDRQNRGVVTGRRVDRVTYVFERAGRAVLPAAVQPWWDLQAGAVKAAHAAGVTIQVASLPPTPAGSAMASLLWPSLGAAAAFLAILGVAGRYLAQRRRATKAYAERDAFAALCRACSGTDTRAIYRALSHWRPYLDPARSWRATQAAASLDAAVFTGSGTAWTMAESHNLVARLAELRRRPVAVPRPARLPPLNPEGEPTFVSKHRHVTID